MEIWIIELMDCWVDWDNPNVNGINLDARLAAQGVRQNRRPDKLEPINRTGFRPSPVEDPDSSGNDEPQDL